MKARASFRGPRACASGFMLIEVLAAAMIAAMAIAAAASLFSSGLWSLKRHADGERSVLLAMRKMDAALISPDIEGLSSGGMEDGLEWSLSVTKADDSGALPVYRLSLTVRDEDASYEITALRAARE